MKTTLITLFFANALFFSCRQSAVDPVSGPTGPTGAAREVASGAGGGGTTACSPVSNFVVKGDYRAGETGTSTIDVAYAVKPCDKNQVAEVKIEIIEFSTKAVLAATGNLPLSGKYAFAQRGLYGVYTAKITVTEAGTGVVLGTQQFSVNLVPKGV